MADKTGIQWTDATWNPFVGCSLVSPACTNCYAMAQAHRIQRMTPGSHYEGTTKVVNGKPVWTGVLKHAPEHILLAPLRWTKPRKIFVNSMSDLFHPGAPDIARDSAFAVMALAHDRGHVFQGLTKRSPEMRAYLSDPRTPERIMELVDEMAREAGLGAWLWPGWPLPNFWAGVTAEDQTRADERIPDLLATPAAVRFVSCEPLLGRIILTPCNRCPPTTTDFCNGCPSSYPARGLDWIICGGESGPNARPMHPDWARELRDQCAAAGVPFFFKQWGEWTPHDFDATDSSRSGWLSPDGTLLGDVVQVNGSNCEKPCRLIFRVGKARAGRLLDGREWNQFPRTMR